MGSYRLNSGGRGPSFTFLAAPHLGHCKAWPLAGTIPSLILTLMLGLALGRHPGRVHHFLRGSAAASCVMPGMAPEELHMGWPLKNLTPTFNLNPQP